MWEQVILLTLTLITMSMCDVTPGPRGLYMGMGTYPAYQRYPDNRKNFNTEYPKTWTHFLNGRPDPFPTFLNSFFTTGKFPEPTSKPISSYYQVTTKKPYVTTYYSRPSPVHIHRPNCKPYYFTTPRPFYYYPSIKPSSNPLATYKPYIGVEEELKKKPVSYTTKPTHLPTTGDYHRPILNHHSKPHQNHGDSIHFPTHDYSYQKPDYQFTTLKPHTTTKKYYHDTTTKKPYIFTTKKPNYYTTDKYNENYHHTTKKPYYTTSKPSYHGENYNQENNFESTEKPYHHTTKPPSYHTTSNSDYLGENDYQENYETTKKPYHYTTEKPTYQYSTHKPENHHENYHQFTKTEKPYTTTKPVYHKPETYTEYNHHVIPDFHHTTTYKPIEHAETYQPSSNHHEHKPEYYGENHHSPSTTTETYHHEITTQKPEIHHEYHTEFHSEFHHSPTTTTDKYYELKPTKKPVINSEIHHEYEHEIHHEIHHSPTKVTETVSNFDLVGLVEKPESPFGLFSIEDIISPPFHGLEYTDVKPETSKPEIQQYEVTETPIETPIINQKPSYENYNNQNNYNPSEIQISNSGTSGYQYPSIPVDQYENPYQEFDYDYISKNSGSNISSTETEKNNTEKFEVKSEDLVPNTGVTYINLPETLPEEEEIIPENLDKFILTPESEIVVVSIEDDIDLNAEKSLETLTTEKSFETDTETNEKYIPTPVEVIPIINDNLSTELPEKLLETPVEINYFVSPETSEKSVDNLENEESNIQTTEKSISSNFEETSVDAELNYETNPEYYYLNPEPSEKSTYEQFEEVTENSYSSSEKSSNEQYEDNPENYYMNPELLNIEENSEKSIESQFNYEENSNPEMYIMQAPVEISYPEFIPEKSNPTEYEVYEEPYYTYEEDQKSITQNAQVPEFDTESIVYDDDNSNFDETSRDMYGQVIQEYVVTPSDLDYDETITGITQKE